jgi:hypothetical protein
LKSIYKKRAFHILGLFALFFTLISTLRPYQLVSKVGWLDPWLSVGMGQFRSHTFDSTRTTWNDNWTNLRIFDSNLQIPNILKQIKQVGGLLQTTEELVENNRPRWRGQMHRNDSILPIICRWINELNICAV